MGAKKNIYSSECGHCGKTFNIDLKNKGIRTWCSDQCRRIILHRSKNKPILKNRNSMPSSLRFRMLKRDGFRCHYCGANPHFDPKVRLMIDHIMPISKGGTDEEKNLITSCEECNLGKSDTDINFSFLNNG